MARQLKIGFLQATNRLDVQWFRPLAFGYLKAYADKYSDGIADMEFLDTPCGADKYDIIGISSTSQDFFTAKELAKQIKRANSKIITILGGHHITYLPHTLSEEFDIGVVGEGEATFLELLQYFSQDGFLLDPERLKNIKGIVFRENGNIVITSHRDMIRPIDNIPFPYRSQKSAPYLFSSRGCPYKCAFCSSSAFWDKTRFFSAEYVVSEIESITKNYPNLTHINIWDDLFIVNKERFKKFIQFVKDRGIQKRVSFAFSVRANLVDDELCEDLKEINISGTSFGAESGSDRILELLKKGTTQEINQMAIDTLHKFGIPVSCSFIIGSPTETEDDVRNTYEFILTNIIRGKLSPLCSVNILMPMPGTEIWSYAVNSGIIDLNNMDWKRLSAFTSYRHSNIRDFSEWVEYRQKNNSIYLAEDTLPIDRLYELMFVYENSIRFFEKNMELEEKQAKLFPALTGAALKIGSSLRRVAGFWRGK